MNRCESLILKKSVWVAGFLLATIFVSVQAVKADPIGPNCGTCQGSIYSLINLGTTVAGTTDILFRIDTSGYTGTGTFIDSVAFKVLDSMTGTSLLAAPGGFANWTIVGGT